jgi:hypothetical protein
MRATNWTRAVAVPAAVLLVLTPRLHAQAQKPTQTLAIPVASIGACSTTMANPAFLSGAAAIRGVRIVVAADEPALRREIALFINVRGEPVEYDETNYGPMVAGGTGEEVVWAKDGYATVRSFMLQHTQAAAGSVRHNRVKLTASDEKNVQSMIGWIRTRCGALLNKS